MPLDNNSGSSQPDQLTSSSSTPPSKASLSDKSALKNDEKKALPDTASADGVEAAKVSPDSSTVPAKKSEENQQDKMGSKFAALSRKEREIQAKNQEVKAELSKLSQEKAKVTAELESERAKLKSEAEAFANERKEYQEFQALKKMNPLKAIEALGFTYQQLTDIVLNDSKPTPEMLYERMQQETEAKLNAYKKEVEERESARAKKAEEEARKALEDEQKAAEQEKLEVLNNFRGEIRDFIQDNSDDYELINLNEASEIVYSVVDKHFEDTGKVMSIKEASDITEQWLAQQVQRNLATKKFQAKVSSPSPKESKEVKSEKAAANSEPKTITNNMTSAASTSAPVSDSEQDRIRRALAALERIA